MLNNTISQKVTEVKQLPEFVIPADGVYPYPVQGEDNWVVIIDGKEVVWASDQETAWRSYHEMLRVDREHARSIPVYANGELAMEIDWVSCPDCGRVRDEGAFCPDCDFDWDAIPFQGEPWPVQGEGDYGLEARA